ncbi:hypothetical protein A2U01_0077627, partial [Trifolium medium]|nr:hypothetical protein [Trifolium medium]
EDTSNSDEQISDNEVEVEVENNDADAVDTKNHENEVINPSNDNNSTDMDLGDDSDEANQVTSPRPRRPLDYLSDYVTGEELPDDDDQLQNLA